MNTAVLVHQPVLASQGDQMNAILMALSALRRGDATVRLPVTGEGAFGKVTDMLQRVRELSEQAARFGPDVVVVADEQAWYRAGAEGGAAAR